MTEAILQLHDLRKSFGAGETKVTPIDSIDLDVRDGEVLAVLGRSGCGKTTLLRLIAGLDKPEAGDISFTKTPRIGVVFQEPRLLPWKSVKENVALALLHEENQAKVDAVVTEVLQLTRMQEAADAWPASLSGGMAQRVALARALAPKPDLLLLDEPFGALDALTRRLMQKELARILQATRSTVLLVTHDVTEALMLADRIVLLEAGKICETWTITAPRPRHESEPEIVQLSQAILSRILGKDFA